MKVVLKNRYLCGFEDVLDGLGDLRSDTVALNQGNSVLALFERSISIVGIVNVVVLIVCSGQFVAGVRCAAGTGSDKKKKRFCGRKTYISTLLTLELGNGLLRRAGVEANLFERGQRLIA